MSCTIEYQRYDYKVTAVRWLAFFERVLPPRGRLRHGRRRPAKVGWRTRIVRRRPCQVGGHAPRWRLRRRRPHARRRLHRRRAHRRAAHHAGRTPRSWRAAVGAGREGRRTKRHGRRRQLRRWAHVPPLVLPGERVEHRLHVARRQRCDGQPLSVPVPTYTHSNRAHSAGGCDRRCEPCALRVSARSLPRRNIPDVESCVRNTSQ